MSPPPSTVDFSALERFVCWEALVLLIGFILAIGHQMLSGRINLHGLFAVKGGGGESSPTRVQLLFISVAYACYYLIQVLHSRTEFPAIPHEILYALGGSHGLYLAAKYNLRSNLDSDSDS